MPDLPKNRLTLAPHQPKGEEGTINASFTAAMSPLEDLGIRKRDIPELLAQLKDNPYSPPSEMKCEVVKDEMAKLDVLLGVDIDSPKAALTDTEEAIEFGNNIATDAVVGYVKGMVSIIPMRSIVRRVTGARKHEKAVQQARQAGSLRRAYLRGLADAKFGTECPLGRTVVASANEAAIVENEKLTDTLATAESQNTEHATANSLSGDLEVVKK